MAPTVSLEVLRAISWTSLLIDGFEVVDMITMMDVNYKECTSHNAMSHITCSQSHKVVRAGVSGKYYSYL